MNTSSSLRHTYLAAVAFALLTVAGPLAAHSSVTTTQPSDGAHLGTSPDAIGLHFDGAMRITQFVVTGPDGVVALAERPDPQPALGFKTAPAEALPHGGYRVEWRALAADGHVMSGSFRFHVGH